jgi:dihydropteroate synthase
LEYQDLVEDVLGYLRARSDALHRAGIDRQRICLDPGIGFAKSHQQNLTLLAALGRFHALGLPLMVGHSNKGFLAKILGNANQDRTFATVGVSLSLAAMGIQILRVHDVMSVRQALLSFAASGGVDGQAMKLEG